MKTIGCVQHDCDECQQLREQNTALDAKLAELEARVEQEPYGYFKPEPFGWTDCAETDEGAIPLYEKPLLMFKPLTDAEIDEIFQANSGYGGDDFHKFARAIEAKLRGAA